VTAAPPGAVEPPFGLGRARPERPPPLRRYAIFATTSKPRHRLLQALNI
jgi:hypothetical protein